MVCSGAIGKYFIYIATVHSYVWHCSWKLKKKNRKLNFFIIILFYLWLKYFLFFYFFLLDQHFIPLSQLSTLTGPLPWPTLSTHAATDLTCLPSSNTSLPLTQLADPSPKSQVDPCRHISDPCRHHPPHPSLKPSSVYSLFSPMLSVQSAIANPRRPRSIVVFVCVFFLCCWFWFGVIQKILNFFKFCLWLVIFDGLGWGKRLGIWY